MICNLPERSQPGYLGIVIGRHPLFCREPHFMVQLDSTTIEHFPYFKLVERLGVDF